jgi:hypothetical protein
MQIVSPMPQVNYMALSPMPTTTNEDEPLIVSSISYDLDPVVEMVIYSIRILELELLTPIVDLDMCFFQSIVLPSNEHLLESMIEFCPLTWCPYRALSSWKP